MALYVHLMVYMGLSLFIIRRAYVYLVVCVLTRITLQYSLNLFTIFSGSLLTDCINHELLILNINH